MSRMLLGLLCLLLTAASARTPTPLAEQNELLFQQIQNVHGLSEAQMHKIRDIFARSGYLGQGNPAITQHPETPQQCAAKLEHQSKSYADANFERICEAKYMAEHMGGSI